MQRFDIHKAAGILIENRQLLAVKTDKTEILLSPGGKLESDETSVEALIRELHEEINIIVTPEDITFYKTYYAPAATQPDKLLRMDTYTVNHYEGKLRASNEIVELVWLNSSNTSDNIAKLLRYDIIPALKQQNLID